MAWVVESLNRRAACVQLADIRCWPDCRNMTFQPTLLQRRVRDELQILKVLVRLTAIFVALAYWTDAGSSQARNLPNFYNKCIKNRSSQYAYLRPVFLNGVFVSDRMETSYLHEIGSTIFWPRDDRGVTHDAEYDKFQRLVDFNPLSLDLVYIHVMVCGVKVRQKYGNPRFYITRYLSSTTSKDETG